MEKATKPWAACSGPIEFLDGYDSCVFSLGHTHAEAILEGEAILDSPRYR